MASRTIFFACVVSLLLSPCGMSGEQGDAVRCRQEWKGAYREADLPEAILIFRRLQTAVKINDRRTVAGMMYYPLHVSGSIVRNRATFLRNYDLIMDAKVRQVIEKQIPECMRGNSHGFSTADGDIWIEGHRNRKSDPWVYTVIAVNSPSWIRVINKRTVK